MVSFITFTKQVFLTLTLALMVQGLAIPIGDANEGGVVKRGDGYLKIDFTIARGSDRNSLNITSNNGPGFLVRKGNVKRGEEQVTLINENTYYATDLTIGSNNQAVTTLLDTGSSDLWVVAKGATCEDPAEGQSSTYCYASGVFDASTSSTYKNLGTSFSIEYEDNTSSTGTWGTETVGITSAGVSVTGLQFGYVTKTSSSFGVLGIAKEGQESSYTEYPNLPQQLKSQGYISKAAYSLYLSSPNASSGTLLFGGIDEDKYTGTLTTLPIVSNPYLAINLDTITVGSTSISASAQPVLDSGTTYTYLSSSTVKKIGQALGGTANSGVGYIIDCDQPTDKYITYKFDQGATIQVPYSELPIPLYLEDGSLADECGLGILSTSSTPILGDNFLRSAYVAYDLDDNTISIAQVQYTTSENIVPFS
ncbi:aspartic peptidase domain-containing protein [Scheffersomyces amazonensis]|uniref:aspartic peptidase domain-containing protein n=1 Tax=Scheffersomyces amazonensis TaxID=1078765 RepID=UPI00315C4EC7